MSQTSWQREKGKTGIGTVVFLHQCHGGNWISWCKSQMASGTIRTGSFWANSAIFQSCILAYNLMVWMMCLNF